ncbi:MAG: hypothetical protein DRJ42_03185 [Deltaproteobacteria bacterium]|nr:MAG: hypothetical protein DRJ42_03185 [Deltaproteobacteria bacterium]
MLLRSAALFSLLVVGSAATAAAQAPEPPEPPEFPPEEAPAPPPEEAPPPSEQTSLPPEEAPPAEEAPPVEAAPPAEETSLPPEEAPPPEAAEEAPTPGADEETDGGFEWPTRIGPLQFDIGIGRVRFGFATQLRLALETDDIGGGIRVDSVAASIRRLRTTLSGRILDDRLTFSFQLNSVPGAFELIDMWVDMEVHHLFRVRLGQMKIPFTRYRQQSFTRLLLVDWSDSTFYFGAERQLGLILHDGPSAPRFSYSVGVFTGQNRRAAHSRGLAVLYGERIVSSSGASNGTGTVDEFHPEVVGHVGHGSADFDTNQMSNPNGTRFQYLVTLSGALDFNPTVADDYFGRVAPELWLKLDHLSFIAVGYLGLIRTAVGDQVAMGTTGFNFELSYRPMKLFEIAARYARTHITENLSTDARGRADDIIAGASSPEEGAALVEKYADVGALWADNELTLGFSFFLIGNSLEWQTDATWKRHERRDGDRDDFRARTQLQLAF